MRYSFGFLCVCALGVVPLVGCFEGLRSESCDGVVCPDDGNECTSEYCVCSGWWCTAECVSSPVVNGTDCTFDGIAGVCVSGVCGENLCEGIVCEDDDACTDDTCEYVDGTCDYAPVLCDDHDSCTEDRCDPADGCSFTPIEDRDGTLCEGPIVGMCDNGVCVAACDPSSEQELQCPIKDLEDWVCCPGSQECDMRCN